MLVARPLAVVLSVLVSALPLTACGLLGEDPKPEDTARAFLSALAGGDNPFAATRPGERPCAAAVRPST